MKKFFYLLSVVFLLISCTNPQQKLPSLSTGQLFEKFRKNVVLIKSRTYYKVTFEDNTVAFFNAISSDYASGFTFNEAEARENAAAGYGTGFFLGKNGLIATNFHVACGGLRQLLSELNFKKTVMQQLGYEGEAVEHSIKYYTQQLKQRHPDDSAYFADLLPANASSTSSSDGDVEEEGDFGDEVVRDTTVAYFHHTIDSTLKLKLKMAELANRNFKIEVVPIELSIMLDGSTGDANEYPCHLYSLTNDKSVDLAIIQTDSKEEPIGINKSIDAFSAKSGVGNIINDKDTIKVTSSLFLIGFNYGPEIAQTSKGIKVQLTKGEVSQDNDDYRVLYSIPSLPGSSGSPVFNSKGQLVAINYCGYETKENFNYGVLAWQLQKLLDRKPSLALPE